MWGEGKTVGVSGGGWPQLCEGRVEEEERTPRLLLGWRVSLEFRDYVRV